MAWESMTLSAVTRLNKEPELASSFALGTLSGEKGDLIVGQVDLTEAQFERYREALDRLHRLEDRLTFRIVEQNFTQLTTLHEYYDNFFSQVKGKDRINERDAGFRLVVETMNWLTAVRLFLDHQETEYKRRHGRSSIQLGRLKFACRSAFDRSVGYRFTYKLRNYAQHCGLPLHSIHVRLSAAGETGVRRIEFQLDRDDLLSEYLEWGSVKKDLKEMPPRFPLLPLVIEAMEELRQIARDVLRIDIEFALDTIQVIREAVDLLGVHEGRGALMVFTPLSDETTELTYAPLPDDAVLARLEG
jgi:hypothetical protein